MRPLSSAPAAVKSRKARERRVRLGLCVHCGTTPPSKGSNRCAKCRKFFRQYAKGRRDNARTHSECIVMGCPNMAGDGITMCVTHHEKRMDAERKRLGILKRNLKKGRT